MSVEDRSGFLQEGLRRSGDTEALKKEIHSRKGISVRKQCELSGLQRSRHYYKPVGERKGIYLSLSGRERQRTLSWHEEIYRIL